MVKSPLSSTLLDQWIVKISAIEARKYVTSVRSGKIGARIRGTLVFCVNTNAKADVCTRVQRRV